MFKSPLDRFTGAFLGAYLGEAIRPFPLSNDFDFNNIDNSRLLLTNITDLSLLKNKQELLFCSLLIILIYPENSRIRENKIREIGDKINLTEPDIEDIIIWGKTIDIILENRTPIGEKVKDFRDYFKSRKDPIGRAIGIALQTFSRTPEDFALCARAAGYRSHRQPLASALTGILAGLYNGVGGIPIVWLEKTRTELGRELEEKARYIYRNWAGITPDRPLTIEESTVIGSGGTIQERQNLRIVSRQPR